MWWVEIVGNRDDLRDLQEALPPGSALEVEEHCGRVCLTGPKFATIPDASKALKTAEEALEIVDLAVNLVVSAHRPVRVGSSVFDEQCYQSSFVKAEPIELRLRVGAVGVAKTGSVLPPEVSKRGIPELALDLMDARELRDVVKLLVVATPTDLYKVFEIIQSSIKSKPHKLGWVSEGEQTRFTRSVNHQDAMGLAARHARSNQQPPPDPMDEAQARAFVHALVRRWIEWLAAERGLPMNRKSS